MTLYTIQVPAPPIGSDWQTVVPGNKLWNVTGITAQLVEVTGPPVVMHDSSGNGNDGTYTTSGYTAGFGAAGIVPGNGALQVTDAVTGLGNIVAAAPDDGLTVGIFDLSADFSIEVWAQQRVLDGFQDGIWLADTIGGGNPLHLTTPGILAGSMFFTFDAFNNGVVTGANTVPNDLLPHHFVCTVVANVGHIYVDGVEVPSTTPFPIGGRTASDCYARFPANDAGSPFEVVKVDEAAIYQHALNAGSVGAHYAAGLAGIAGYEAAVLADGPTGYYHLDEVASFGRQAELVITDGTHDVMVIPTGFVPVPGASTVEFSWQPGLASSTQSPDGTLVTVSIPPLVLPAGYTVGTRTPDLQGADQWSDVVVWWNDNLDPNGSGGVPPYDYHNLLLLSH